MSDDARFYEPARTKDGIEELLRPVAHGFCKYESLIDGTLSLFDIAEMNDMIDLIDENKLRAEAAIYQR